MTLIRCHLFNRDPEEFAGVDLPPIQDRFSELRRQVRLGGTGSASVDGLVQAAFPGPRDVRVHWQSQCHTNVRFQSERQHAQEPFGAQDPHELASWVNQIHGYNAHFLLLQDPREACLVGEPD